MSSIAEATPIILTSEERPELESLARSTKTEYRARVNARIDGGGWRGHAGDHPSLAGKEVRCLTIARAQKTSSR
jgi:hypothetical protein